MICLVRGHQYDHPDERIREAAQFVATWANRYRAKSLIVNVHVVCSRCGNEAEAATIEGYLVDDRWVTMCDTGVLTL